MCLSAQLAHFSEKVLRVIILFLFWNLEVNNATLRHKAGHSIGNRHAVGPLNNVHVCHITHLITIIPASQLRFLANKNAGLPWPQPVNCINIRWYVELLCGSTVHSLYRDLELSF